MKEPVRLVLAAMRPPALRGLLLGLGCALASWLLSLQGIMRGLDDSLVDGSFFYRGTRPTKFRVVVIGLDETSLDEMKKPLVDISPQLAKVVTFAKSKGASAIGLDLMVPESLNGRPDLDIGQPGDASKLGQAIADAGNVVLIQRENNGHWVRPLKEWQLKSFTDPSPRGTDFGFVNLTEDTDYFLRRQQLFVRTSGRPGWNFALALYAVATGTEIEVRGDDLLMGGEHVPLEAEHRLRINFTGPPGSFPVVPFRDALAAAEAGQPLPQGAPDLSGAIVIIGVTARDQQDFHQTPWDNSFFRKLAGREPGLMSGSEIHGHVIATLADRAFIVTPPWLSPLPLMVVTGMLLGMVFTRLNLEWGALVAVGYHFGWKALGVAAFSWANWHLEMAGMLLLGFLTYGVTFGLRWRQLRRMFGVVKSEAIAQALETDPRNFDLRGEERLVTVLFADVRSFTDFSESHSPREVVALLNAYFTAIVPLIEDQGGTLNTYMGDGIMVIYGAPRACADHAQRAIRTGIAMVRRVHELKEQWARLGSPAFRIGVGIHTGTVVVGTVGSPRRLDYTAIGDAVNAAARIEAENKRLHSEILVSSETYQVLSVKERAALGLQNPPELAEVKGKKQALYLYSIPVA